MSIGSITSKLSFLIYSGAIYYDINYMPRIGAEWWIVKLVMLTNINMVIQTFYSLVLVFSHGGSPKLKKFTDFTFFTTAFPCGLVTCILFWALYLADPETIMPRWIRDTIPFWMNHITHTFPLIALPTDLLFNEHKSINLKHGTIMVLSLFGIYSFLVVYIRLSWGYWLYPIFEFIGPTFSIIFLFLAGFVFWSTFYLGYKIHYMTRKLLSKTKRQ